MLGIENPKASGAPADARDRLPIGAEVRPDGVRFRVWAPKRQRVEVVIEGDAPYPATCEPRAYELAREADGYHSGVVPDAADGWTYRYRLDGELMVPDPVSRFQPAGPHGPSQVVDPGAFAWTDRDWKGVPREGQVFYEMHVGTFTREGTWEAAGRHLASLRDLGITCLEVMPVGEFPGHFGWGYDGACLFAPYHVYGTPDDIRRFVDRAHALGLGVILDVVYNHFGPDGAYFGEFADSYFHGKRPDNEWGASLNFDGPDGGPVRELFVQNARYWIDEFHLDGFRFDATQAIDDDSPEHILAEVGRAARAAAPGRTLYLVAENEPQDARMIRPGEAGGCGLDALWNDDFHHAAIVALTGRAEAYYCDYAGSPQEIVSAVRKNFLFQGQFCKWQQMARGTDVAREPADRFVTFLENHDQVANSGRGDRLIRTTSPGRYRAMTAAWLLAPQTPMLFQGQEDGSERPFLYFADHNPDLAPLVRAGRRQSLAQFPSLAGEAMAARLDDPEARETFLRSKLDDDRRGADGPTRRLFADLLKLRREDPLFRSQRADLIDGAVLGPEAFALRYFAADGEDTRLIVVNLGRDLYPAPATEPLLAPPEGHRWAVLWQSEDPRYGGSGLVEPGYGLTWRVVGHAAMVLVPEPAPDDDTDGGRSPAERLYPGNLQEIHPRILGQMKAE